MNRTPNHGQIYVVVNGIAYDTGSFTIGDTRQPWLWVNVGAAVAAFCAAMAAGQGMDPEEAREAINDV